MMNFSTSMRLADMLNPASQTSLQIQSVQKTFVSLDTENATFKDELLNFNATNRHVQSCFQTPLRILSV